MLGRLRDILDQQYHQLLASELSEDNFDKPEFASRQAFYLGKKKTLADLRKLLEFFP